MKFIRDARKTRLSMTLPKDRSKISRAELTFISLTMLCFMYIIINKNLKASRIKWASRWDYYLLNAKENDKIHWNSIGSASILIIIFSSMVIYIFARALKKDIELYNSVLLIINYA